MPYESYILDVRLDIWRVGHKSLEYIFSKLELLLDSVVNNRCVKGLICLILNPLGI